MTFNLRFFLFLSTFVFLTACGGGGGSDSSAPSPVITPPQPSQNLEEEYRAFIERGGEVPAELSLAVYESFIQLANMANDHILLAKTQSGVIACEGDILGNGQGTFDISTSQPEIVDGTRIEIQLSNCYNPYMTTVLQGNYSILIGDTAQGSTTYQLETQTLQARSFDGRITLTGALEVQHVTTSEQQSTTISTIESDFTYNFDLIDVNTVETISNLNISRVSDYASASYSINGGFTQNSTILEETFTANFTRPYTGLLNTFPDAGELTITGLDIPVRLTPKSDGNGSYEVSADLSGSNSFYVGSENSEYEFSSILEGTLFNEPLPYFDPNGIDVLTKSENIFELVSFEGVLGKDQADDTYFVSSPSELTLRFTRPISFDGEGVAPRLNYESENQQFELALNYTLNGALLQIQLPDDLVSGLSYQLNINPSAESQIYITKKLVREKVISVEVLSDLFGLTGRSFDLNAEVLLAGDLALGSLEWQQLSGPELDIINNVLEQNITLPSISGDTDEVALIVTATALNGEVSQQEFRFLIVKNSLNRDIVYFPFTQSGSQILTASKEQRRIFSSENRYDYVHDKTYDGGIFGDYAQITLENITLSNGSSVIDISGDAATRVEQTQFLIEELCDVRQLGRLDPDRLFKLFANNVNLQDGVIKNGQFKVNRYCQQHDQIRDYFGLLVQDGIFNVESPGFVYAGSSSPLSISEDAISELSVSQTPEGLIDVSHNFDEISTIATNETTDVNLTFARDTESRRFEESQKVNLINRLSEKVFVYFDRSYVHFEDNVPPIQYQYSDLFDTSSATITVDREIQKISVDIDSAITGEPTSFAFSIFYVNNFPPINEKVNLVNGEYNGDIFNLSVPFNSTVCRRDDSGWFNILELEQNADSDVTKLSVDIYHPCVAYGGYNRASVRFNSDLPVNPVSEP